MAALGQACEEECRSVLGHPGARVIPRTPFGVLPGVLRSGRIVASVWRPLECRATREGSPVAARSADEHGLRGTSSVTGNARNDGVGGSSPPVGFLGKPHEQGHSGRRGAHWHRCSRRCGVPFVHPSPTAGHGTTHDQAPGLGSASAWAVARLRGCTPRGSRRLGDDPGARARGRRAVSVLCAAPRRDESLAGR